MELHAPPRWQCVDFLSDLHLQASETHTLAAWQHYLQSTVADAVFLLGDIFEVWVGDDTLTQPGSFEAQCADTLRAAAQRLDLHILHGNRDFLMGPALATAAHMTLLDDPTVLVFADERWVLTHGDALCLDDTDYLQFRAKVRGPDWQRDFLAKPLAERNAIAHDLRAQSEARKRSVRVYADVDTGAALDLLHTHGAHHLVHGHTHRPATHRLDDTHERLVLSDWDLGATLPRADVLRLRRPAPGAHTAFTLERIPPAMAGRSGGA
jgi:UDP-2,3-diacylglucosamine hydrolase